MPTMKYMSTTASDVRRRSCDGPASSAANETANQPAPFQRRCATSSVAHVADDRQHRERPRNQSMNVGVARRAAA